MASIIGVSAYYHDSAACLVQNGQIVAAVQEERFTRKKHDASFPEYAIKYCLLETKLDLKDIDYIVFYDKPLIKFERLLETYLAKAPIGIGSFLKSMPIWLKEKLYLKAVLKEEFAKIAQCEVKSLPPLLFTEHHQSHAASAFYPSPFDAAAVLCLDGVGEWATSSVWIGEGSELRAQWQINFPHSLGLLYSAFTYFCGFKVNSGEYKLMGLAPYGEPKYADLIFKELIDVKDDGTFRLNMHYFNYLVGFTMTNNKFVELFGGPARLPESSVTQREMDIAASIQKVTEEVVIKLAKTVKKELDVDNLCLAGGVALNCVANGKLLKEKIFEDIWIQPAAGDAGGAIGAALTVWYQYLGNKRQTSQTDNMSGSYLGPAYDNKDIKSCLDEIKAPYRQYNEKDLLNETGRFLEQGNVIGWFQGRMEFGPRALGNRSIIGDPRDKNMQTKMNLKIKYRESFRPFAPSILEEDVNEYFDMDKTSPYMLLVANINEKYKLKVCNDDADKNGLEKLKVIRSTLPSITHVDYSARIQTVNSRTNNRYYNLIKVFKKLTGCPVLINTSFNVRGEPVVCTPEDAYHCFMRTEMDYLIIEDFILAKSEQPDYQDDKKWRQEFSLD